MSLRLKVQALYNIGRKIGIDFGKPDA